MTNLIAAYQKNDIMEFEKILKVSALEQMPFPCLLQSQTIIFWFTDSIVIFVFFFRAIEEQ